MKIIRLVNQAFIKPSWLKNQWFCLSFNRASSKLAKRLLWHARIQEFSSGGVQVSVTKKLLRFLLFFLVLSFFYRSQMVNFKEIYHFSRFQRGSNIFQGGGGVQLLIPYRNPYNLWFSRGGPDTLSPHLDPHLCDRFIKRCLFQETKTISYLTEYQVLLRTRRRVNAPIFLMW